MVRPSVCRYLRFLGSFSIACVYMLHMEIYEEIRLSVASSVALPTFAMVTVAAFWLAMAGLQCYGDGYGLVSLVPSLSPFIS